GVVRFPRKGGGGGCSGCHFARSRRPRSTTECGVWRRACKRHVNPGWRLAWRTPKKGDGPFLKRGRGIRTARARNDRECAGGQGTDSIHPPLDRGMRRQIAVQAERVGTPIEIAQ